MKARTAKISPLGTVSVSLLLSSVCTPLAAMGLGVSSLGTTGGLHTPSAQVLETGEAALSMGTDQDPRFGQYETHRNYTAGFGVFPGIEFFGKLSDYSTDANNPLGYGFDGLRDLSANIKWQLPFKSTSLPKLAVGMTDLGGGISFFKSAYVVASDEIGPLRWSLGYASAKGIDWRGSNIRPLNGAFGGGEWLIGDTRATFLAETNGVTNHVGLRYYSKPLSWLGNAQLVGSVQRSIGATDATGNVVDATRFNATLVIPMGASNETRDKRANTVRESAIQPGSVPAKADQVQALAVGSPSPNPVSTEPSVGNDPLESLQRALIAHGFDRVRVGSLEDAWVIEFENLQYLNNEVDALGVVLGLAVNQAPKSVQRVNVVSLKSGLPVLHLSVSPTDYREFLHWGSRAAALASMDFSYVPNFESDAVHWLGADARRSNFLKLSINPVYQYTVGTEVGPFDYALGARIRASIPLWKGAQLYADAYQPLTNSENVEPGRLLEGMRITEQVGTIALQQSFWLGSRIFNNYGVGRYRFGSLGIEGESIFYSPWNDDTFHVRSMATYPVETEKYPYITHEQAWMMAYRRRFNSSTWLEWQSNKYQGGGYGPSMVMTRWFGDVGLQFILRRDTSDTFAGVRVLLPAAPRRGMKAGPVLIQGSPVIALGMMTKIVSPGGTNDVFNATGAPVSFQYAGEIEQLNVGRVTPEYIKAQLIRMRESFYLHVVGVEK